MVRDIFWLNSAKLDVECQDFEFDEEIDDDLKIFLDEDGIKAGHLWEMLLNENVESPQQFKAATMLYLASIFISLTSDDGVLRNYLSVTRDVDNICNLNWTKHLLNRLCEGVKC